MRASHAVFLLPLALAGSCADTADESPTAAVTDTGPNGLFHDTQETWTELRALTVRFPSRASVGSIGRSVEGREIPVLRIRDGSAPAGRPNIYILGAEHANEWIGVEVSLFFARCLLERAGREDAVRRLLREAQIHVLPIVNPDGLEFSIHTSRGWRKNRRFDFMWGCDDRNSSPVPASNHGWHLAPDLHVLAIGLAAVFAYAVAQRTRGIGIRMALGASPASVVQLVLASSLRAVPIGVTVGFVLAAQTFRFLRPYLYGQSAFDPIVYVGVLFLLGATALVASYLPVRRATGLQPSAVLRCE